MTAVIPEQHLRTSDPVAEYVIPCITQSHSERPHVSQAYLDVCTKHAELIARSTYCPSECGGHPICRPCYKLSKEMGLLV